MIRKGLKMGGGRKKYKKINERRDKEGIEDGGGDGRGIEDGGGRDDGKGIEDRGEDDGEGIEDGGEGDGKGIEERGVMIKKKGLKMGEEGWG